MQHVLTPYAEPMETFAWWDGGFTEAELDWLQQKARNANVQAQIGGAEATNGINKNIRRSQVNWLNNTSETQWVFQRLGDIASKLNAQFFRFDLTGFGEALQLTHYDQSEHGMYGWHQDYGSFGPSRKLSLVLQLSDPADYEGGNLQLMTSGDPVNVRKQRGLVAAFPAYVMHQVTPVTQGNRQTLVAWVSGPAFK